MKKWLSMLMAAVLLVTAAAALADDVITLRVWGGVPAEAGPQASIDLFNEAFKDKGIQAEYERFVNDDTGNLKLETSLLAGNDVDLYMTYPGRAAKACQRQYGAGPDGAGRARRL